MSSIVAKGTYDLLSIALNPRPNIQISPFSAKELEIALHITLPKKSSSDDKAASAPAKPIVEIAPRNKKNGKYFNPAAKTPRFLSDAEKADLPAVEPQKKKARVEVDKEACYAEAKQLYKRPEVLAIEISRQPGIFVATVRDSHFHKYNDGTS